MLPQRTIARDGAENENGGSATYLVWVLSVALALPPFVHALLYLAARLPSPVSHANPESAAWVDRLTWVIIALTALGLAAWARASGRGQRNTFGSRISRLGLAPGVLAISMWLLSVSWIQALPDFDTDAWWWGFGTPVAIASIALAIAILCGQRTRSLRHARSFLVLLVPAIILTWYLPLMLQPPWAIYDLYHTRYLINEVLAPASGNFALGSFAPLYTSLLGIPLLLLMPLAATGLVLPYFAIATIWLTLLTIFFFVLLIMVARKVLPSSLRYLAALLTIPLVLVSQSNPSAITGTITAVPSAIPGRMLGFIAIALSLLWVLTSPKPLRVFTLGLICGSSALNNLEFGITSVVAAFLVLAIARRLSLKLWTILLLGVCLVPFAYLVFVWTIDGHIRVDYATVFIANFGSGFGEIAMPVVGTWTAIAGILIVGVVVGVTALPRKVNHELLPAGLALYVGAAGILQFGYYAGRSVTSGQLQIFLTHVSLIIVSLIALGSAWGIWRTFNSQTGVLILVCALPIACLISIRPPAEEWSRLAPIGKGTSILRADSDLEGTISAVEAAKQGFPDRNIGFIVEAGNYTQLETGAVNLLPSSNPADLKISKRLAEEVCLGLAGFDGIVVTQPLFGLSDNPYCGFNPRGYVNGALVIDTRDMRSKENN